MQLQLAVRRENSRAPARGTSADDVLFYQRHLQTLAQKLDRGADTAKAAADYEHVALDVLSEWWTVLVLPDGQGRDPPVLIHHPFVAVHGHHLTRSAVWQSARSEEHTSELQSLRHLVC